MRTTDTVVRIAIALMADPDGRHWGYGLAEVSAVQLGTVYPILARMLSEGWLVDGWEDPGTVVDRPPRRYYVLTDVGRVALDGMLREVRVDRRFTGIPGLDPRG